MTTQAIHPASAIEAGGSSAAGRWTLFLLGVSFYGIGVFGLCWLIACCLGFVPFTGGPVSLDSTAAAVALNLGLVALFGVQHAVMARPAFKERWTKVVPPALERSIFTLLAGLLMALAMWLWQPLSGQVWSFDAPVAKGALWTLGALGWGYLFASTFAIDHFELFGLRQVFANLRGRSAAAPSFKRRLMYRFDRHPIMSGVLVGLWATPDMSVTRLVLALGFTCYVVVGVAIEERTLMQLHPASYSEYRREVGSIVPYVGRRH